jgi:C4-dicarboxylate transporter DctM subunit
MIFMIFLGADLMNAALALTQVPAQLAAWCRAGACRPWLVVGASCCSMWCWAR